MVASIAHLKASAIGNVRFSDGISRRLTVGDDLEVSHVSRIILRCHHVSSILDLVYAAKIPCLQHHRVVRRND